MDEVKKVVLQKLSVLNCVIPFSKILHTAVEKDFVRLSSCEGYELLRYLLSACGRSLDYKKSLFMSTGNLLCKEQFQDHKADIEKWKKDILQAIKNLGQENNLLLKPLRKSDLVSPSNLKFLNCCLSLSQFAINHQLEKFGIKIDMKLLFNSGEREDFFNLYHCFIDQEKELECESKILHTQTEKYLKETEELIREINNHKKIKNEIEAITKEVIERCPLTYRDALKDPSTRLDTINSWLEELNELCIENNNRELMLKNLDTNLKKLCCFLNGDIEKACLDGNDLVSHISPELLVFACENEVDILDGDSLSLLGLLKILLLSIPQETTDLQGLEKFLDFNYTPTETELLEKLQSLEDGVKSEINNLRQTLGIENLTPDEDWLKEFFPVVPEIGFTNELQHQPQSSANFPFIDFEKLEALLK